MKYIIKRYEVVLYEVEAENKEEAELKYENGDGDFVGYDENEEYIIQVVEK